MGASGTGSTTCQDVSGSQGAASPPEEPDSPLKEPGGAREGRGCRMTKRTEPRGGGGSVGQACGGEQAPASGAPGLGSSR